MYLMVILNIMAILSYLAGSGLQVSSLIKQRHFYRVWQIFGLLAITIHAYLLYVWIDGGVGQNLTQMNLISLAAWLISLATLIFATHKPIAYLSVFIFPLTCITIFLANTFPSHHILQTSSNLKQLIHIISSILTFSIFACAGIQAILLAIQQNLLRHKYLSELVRGLPPLETMENLLFQMITFGFATLSIVLITSIVFFKDTLLTIFLGKTIVTVLAWLVFTVLLIGHHHFGWRGKKAIYCTLSGAILLTFTYCSMIITELLA